MRKFNLIKSLTRVMNNSKGLLILCLFLATFGVGNAWGADNTFGKAYSVPGIHAGGVYVTVNGNSPSSDADYKEYDQSGCYKATKYSIQATGKFMAKAWTGWKFSGWFSSSNCSGTAKNISTTYEEKITGTQTLTLYAKFTPITYSITYNGVPSGVNNPNSSTYNIESETITFSSLTRTGYTFSGWNPASIAKGSTGDKSTTANWTANKYNVTYDAQEGLIEGTDSKTIEETYDGKYTCPIPTRDGYDFQGWFTETSGGSEVTSNTQVKITTPQTLYARWQVVNVVINKPTENKTVDFKKQTETLTTTLAFPVDNATSTSNFNEPVSSNAEWEATDYSYSNNVVTVTLSFTATENVTTHGDHSSTITLTGKNGASATGQVTAHVAMTPILTDNVPTNKLVDDAAIDLNTLWTSTSNGAKTYTIKTWMPDGGAHNGGAVKPAINGSTLSLGDAGTLVLQLSQAAGTSSEAKTAEHTLTINRRDNNIFINGSKDSYATSIYMDAEHSIALTATNTDYSGSPITATPTSGNTIAALNAAQTQVTSNHNLGTATWTISQPENYKYKAANATLTVNVVQQAEATDCYVLEHLAEETLNTIQTGDWMKLNGPADILTFEAWRSSNITGTSYLYLDYAKENNTSNPIEISLSNLPSETYTPFEISLPSSTTHIRFRSVTGATNKRKYKNVRVTRKTYLNASDVDITKTALGNDIHPNEEGVGNLNISYSFANNSGDTKIVWDNANFTINGKSASEGVNLGDLGCSSGIINSEVKYKSNQVIDADVAHVTIYNKVWNETFTITGKTIKRDQEIQWNTDIMIVGQTKENAAQTNSILDRIVTYTSDNTEVIRVNNDANGQPTILEALQPGTANITAFSAGNNEYNNASDTKEITVTDKDIQYIVWNQSLMGLKMGDADVPLNASAYQPDSLNCATGGQRPITYSSANTAVVEIVDGNKLRIKGIGVTTVTASQAGGKDNDGHDFIAVTAEKKVVVRDPNAPCETYIYEQTSEVKFDLGWNAASHQTKTYEIDFQGQEPRSVNFDYKGEVHKVLINYYAGNLIIEQYLSGQWKEVKNLGEPGTSGYTNTGDIALDRNATKMRVKANDGMGYMYFKDCQVTLARYLEGSPLNTFETKVGSPVQQTLTVSYSNISGPLTFSLSGNSNFTIDKSSLDGVCGDTGSTTIGITYTPNAEAINEEATLTLADGENKTYITLNGKASVTPLHIDWNIPDNNSCYTIDNVALNATALTDLNVEVPNFVWFSLAQNSTTGTLTGNTLTFDKAGNANVIAQTTGDPRYTPAINVFKNWTVNLTPTTISKLPTIGNIVSGTDKETIVLTDWQVINTVNSEPVEGNLSITAGDLTNAGTKTITLTFTPDNTDMYESCTTDMQVEVFYYTFIGTDGNWANENNWLYNTMPENDTNDVVIIGQLTITEDKTFTTLTLNGDTSSVSIANDVKVIIQNGSLTETGTTPITNYGQMNILSNATLALNGGIFHANRLSLTGGLYKSNETKTYGVPHLYIAPEASMALTNEEVNYFLNIDAANYYPFAVPFEVPVSSIHYAKTEYTYAQCYGWNAAEIDYYDGADRANKNTSSLTNSQYWKPIKTDGNLQPGVGYIISALPLSETEANLQMTMTIPNSAVTNGEQAKTVSIAANAGTEKTSWNNKGWNYIANPYMSKFNNNEDDELMLAQEYTGSEGVYEPISPAVRYVTVPSETMSDYTQTPANAAIIEPFRGFFIQAANDGFLSFENVIRAAVPARMSAYQEEAYPEQQAYLRVSDGCNSDMIGLIIHENYSADYDVNADLVKMLGETNSLRSYLTYEGNKMAFLALNQDLAIEAIPVGVRIPKNTIYTWSVDSISNTDMLDALYLMDYTTNTMTNLLVSDYSFTADAGTINERFAINAVVNPNRQPTETRHTITKNQDTQKIIFRNHLYIVHKGIVYDGQGTRVTNIQ